MQPLTTFRIIGLLLVFCAPLLGACGGAAPESAADPYAESGNEQPVALQQEVVEEPTATSLPADTPVPATPTDEPATTPATATSQPAEAPAEKEVVAEAEPTSPPDPTATEAPPAKPTPRQELLASSPGEVALASGQVQLVEFFAYW